MDEEAPPPLPSSAPAPAVKPLSCPACGGAIELKAAGYTVTLICPYCSSVLDTANPDVRLIQRHAEESAALEIPLGTRGTLKGVEWEAIGYLQRSEGGAYPWEEYLLFNPYHGYRWLVTDGRGWTLSRQLTATPAYVGPGELAVEGQTYKAFFAQGRAQVDYVLGEFYWRVKVGEQVETADYVRPGFMLSFEANASERSWSVGELIDPKVMAQAFGVDPPPRWRSGGPPPMPHQPSPFRRSVKSFWTLALLEIVALFLLTAIFGGTGDRQSFAMTVQTGGAAESQTLGPVTFSRPWQAVTLGARAPDLENAWIDIDYALVNRKTQESYAAYGVAERYSGTDSEGAWSEGSRSNTSKLAMVPAGEYDLIVEASGQNWGAFGANRAIVLTVSVAQGGRFWSNLWLALILLIIPAIVVLVRHTSFEAARAGESDFASSGDDDEDDDE